MKTMKMTSEDETIHDIVAEMRTHERGSAAEAWYTKTKWRELCDRIEAAWKRERDEIVSAVSELKDGMCIHCDLQQQCAEGEDGMPTTCNAMAKVRNFLQRYEKQEVNDGLPF